MADSMRDSRSDVQAKLNAKIFAYGHSPAPYNSQKVLLDGCQVGPLKRVGHITTTYYYQLSFSYNLRRRQWKIYPPHPLHKMAAFILDHVFF